MTEAEAAYADILLEIEERLEWCVIALAAEERGERLKAEAHHGGSDLQ